MTREASTESILQAAEAALVRGDAAAAERRLNEALRAEPRQPDLTRSLARLLARQQRFGDAADCLRTLTGPDGPDAELRAELGGWLRLAGRLEEAEVELSAVLAERPGHEDAAYTLAFLLRDRSRWREAVAIVGALGEALDGPEALMRAAGFLWELGAYRETLRVLDKVVERAPEDARAHLLRGRAHEVLGRFDAALAAVREALTLRRDLPAAWLRLTRLRRVTDAADPDLARLQRAVDDPGLGNESRACAGFALGKAWDDLGHYRRAFEHLVEANRRWPHRGQWSRAAWERQVDETIRAFPAIRQGDGSEGGRNRPIFVVGMLRSGTTLLERLLARHPAVAARGELNWIPEIAARLPAPGWPVSWRSVPDADRARLRALYLQHAVRQERGIRAFVDKNPLNFRYLGLIAELFPGAVLVHMRRDPRDVGLSLFQQAFEDSANAYAYELDDIVAFYRGYEKLMAHWQSRLGARLQVVHYEELVADPEGIAASVLDRLGLTPPREGEAPETGGIRTASAWQARQPVHRQSVQRWRHYRDLAPGFFRALAPP